MKVRPQTRPSPDPPEATQWHIEIGDLDPYSPTNTLGQAACGYDGKSPNFLGTCIFLADYPFQVTCPKCRTICEQRMAEGNPEKWPVGRELEYILELRERRKRLEEQFGPDYDAL